MADRSWIVSGHASDSETSAARTDRTTKWDPSGILPPRTPKSGDTEPIAPKEFLRPVPADRRGYIRIQLATIAAALPASDTSPARTPATQGPRDRWRGNSSAIHSESRSREWRAARSLRPRYFRS